MSSPLTCNISQFRVKSEGECKSFFSRLARFLMLNKALVMRTTDADSDARKMIQVRDAIQNTVRFEQFWLEKFGSQEITLDLLKTAISWYNVTYTGDNILVAQNILISIF